MRDSVTHRLRDAASVLLRGEGNPCVRSLIPPLRAAEPVQPKNFGEWQAERNSSLAWFLAQGKMGNWHNLFRKNDRKPPEIAGDMPVKMGLRDRLGPVI